MTVEAYIRTGLAQAMKARDSDAALDWYDALLHELGPHVAASVRLPTVMLFPPRC